MTLFMRASEAAMLALGLAFLALIIFLLRRTIGPKPLPYFLKPFLLSRGEAAFYQCLRRAIPSHLGICMKVRISDLIGCTGQGWKEGFGGKISQKHVDFVLIDAESSAIAIAIELDDQSHRRSDRTERDIFVDRAFTTVGLPLLRVPAAANYDVRALRAQIDEALKAAPQSEAA